MGKYETTDRRDFKAGYYFEKKSEPREQPVPKPYRLPHFVGRARQESGLGTRQRKNTRLHAAGYGARKGGGMGIGDKAEDLLATTGHPWDKLLENPIFGTEPNFVTLFAVTKSGAKFAHDFG